MPAARAGLARRVEAADPYEGAPALVDSVHEDGPAVLRAEDHVVAAGENYVAVALVLHGIDIIQY